MPRLLEFAKIKKSFCQEKGKLKTHKKRDYPQLIHPLKSSKGNILHIESRQSKVSGAQIDVLLKVEITTDALLSLLKVFRQSASLVDVLILNEHKYSIKGKCIFKFCLTYSSV